MTARTLTWLGTCVLLISSVPRQAWGDPEASPLAKPLPPSPIPTVSIRVDARANRRAISPEIYGVAFATAAQLMDLNVPLNRNGGNHTSRYNWQQDASNRGSDWYFQSVPESTLGTPGGSADAFVSATRSAGAASMLTVPTLGWVAKLGLARLKLSSFSILKYGPQLYKDWQWFPDAGNGVRLDGIPITGNDPHDANTPATPAFQQSWLWHLVGRWGTAAQGGVRYYLLDNEPSLWHVTHRDVRPTGATMEEVRDRMIAYGAAVKAVDPSARLVGPEEWGWSGYFYSGYDQQYAQANNYPPPAALPDRAAHGGMDYLPWLLDQLRQEAVRTGRRTLDVFTLHYYPQGGEYSDDTSTEMQLRRNRSTRALWDANYVDESWINDRVQLIPRMRSWVNTYYPGTRVGLTEYHWGAEGHINGATAQADLLGLFGREGLDMAVRWGTPAASTPTYKAIKLYRNYDGQRSTFGDVSVAATAPDPDTVSTYAAQRSSDGALTIMVVGKFLSGSASVSLELAGFLPKGFAQVWQLTSANSLTRKADVTLSGTRLTTTVPAGSVTLFVVPPGQ
ncbi:glycoside hydrolase family 44 protein [Hyalangium rubrum]|uniref:Glycoside hydrolase family 44 protein n=1 Tax=Hyalangium rubrum TaxID=3103134 RepID=A0ABU5H396_9BACT|nr:glycoside hydrolase family 44 protein [Hyalangium sp. s54d21]MDY7227574.1 glycoside hydrolase family 44 protein [Hyalangium sp. s54d21]